jgi:hypothetical protein
MLASSKHSCDRWHSSQDQESNALTVVTINYVEPLKVEMSGTMLELFHNGSIAPNARCSSVLFGQNLSLKEAIGSHTRLQPIQQWAAEFMVSA